MPESKPELSPKIPVVIRAQDRIKTIGEIFKDVFAYYKEHLKKILAIGVIGAIVFTFSATVLTNTTTQTGVVAYTGFEELPYFDYQFQPLMFFNNLLFIGLIIHVASTLLMASLQQGSLSWKQLFRSLFSAKVVNALMVGTVFSAAFWLPASLRVVLLLVLAPILLQAVFISYYEGLSLLGGLERFKETFSVGALKVYGLYVALLFLTALFVLLIRSPLVDFYQEVLEWNFNLEGASRQLVWQTIDSFKFIFAVAITIPILLSGLGIQYFSLKEILEANYLNAQISKF